MSIYRSEKKVYDQKKRKLIPLWKFDTNTLTVACYNIDNGTIEEKTYTSDYVRYHVNFSSGKYPDRLRRLVNEGRIIEYLDDIEENVQLAIEKQVEKWKKEDKEYITLVNKGNIKEAAMLEKCFVYMAREIIFNCMVYV